MLKVRLPLSRAKKLPPITIFPEGTYNNGEYCLKFKKGAFEHQHPIKIRATSFRKDGLWTCSWTNTHPYLFFTLMMTVPDMFMEVFEVEEPLDPYYVYQKYGINHDHPDAWKYVMQEAKSIICFMSGFKSTEMGFKEIFEYEQISFKKHDLIGGTFARRNGCQSKNNFYKKTTCKNLVLKKKEKIEEELKNEGVIISTRSSSKDST